MQHAKNTNLIVVYLEIRTNTSTMWCAALQFQSLEMRAKIVRVVSHRNVHKYLVNKNYLQLHCALSFPLCTRSFLYIRNIFVLYFHIHIPEVPRAGKMHIYEFIVNKKNEINKNTTQSCPWTRTRSAHKSDKVFICALLGWELFQTLLN